MSLIQEALRRQREDAERGGESDPAANENPGSSPPPVPHQPRPAGGEQHVEAEPPRRAWPALFAAVLSLTALLGSGSWLIWTAYRHWFAPPEPPPQPTPPAVVTNAVAEPSNAGEGTPTPARQLPEPRQDAAAGQPAAAVTNASSRPTAAVTVGGPGKVPPPQTPATPEPAHPPVRWPDLTIDGIVGSSEKGAVMVNSRILQVGESIEGVEIVAVGKAGVTLSYKGETRTVRAGGTTR